MISRKLKKPSHRSQPAKNGSYCTRIQVSALVFSISPNLFTHVDHSHQGTLMLRGKTVLFMEKTYVNLMIKVLYSLDELTLYLYHRL